MARSSKSLHTLKGQTCITALCVIEGSGSSETRIKLRAMRSSHVPELDAEIIAPAGKHSPHDTQGSDNVAMAFERVEAFAAAA